MSDQAPPILPRPPRPPTWRERVAALAESLDLSPRRLVVGSMVLAVLGVASWRLLAPPAPPPEMSLPFASTTSVVGPDGPVEATGSGVAGSTDAASGAPGADGLVEVVVHVAGAVARPGVQRLPVGSRVIDAIDAAGGALPDADLVRVNLAAGLADGQQVFVPRVGEAPPVAVGAPAGNDAAAGIGSADASGAGSGRPVNLNTASLEELDTLPGVGPTTAQAIVSWRESNGRFASVEQLLDVRGIGEAKLDQLRDLVVV